MKPIEARYKLNVRYENYHIVSCKKEYDYCLNIQFNRINNFNIDDHIKIKNHFFDIVGFNFETTMVVFGSSYVKIYAAKKTIDKVYTVLESNYDKSYYIGCDEISTIFNLNTVDDVLSAINSLSVIEALFINSELSLVKDFNLFNFSRPNKYIAILKNIKK